jgi:hypothetical protein
VSLEMEARDDGRSGALVVAACVFADEYPVSARPGRRAQVSDAELVALAVCQAVMGIPSDRQVLGLVGRVLAGWFPHLPSQSQYNRRLGALVQLIACVQQHLARWLDGGEVRLAEGTLLGCANYPGCASHSAFAGFVRLVLVSDPRGVHSRLHARSRQRRRSTSRSPTCSPAARAKR